ncbi:putative holin [Erwinia sp. 198]|uniref:putative holin n=1 Tax=Erwinia sp. 198 TaxID=2022746 RepID=UPI000F67A7C6|nr:putative holin [Erwinia sp. 198]RRZ95629.1 hypothetical protein EGK14_03475 [Erwinia sp. 198]
MAKPLATSATVTAAGWGLVASTLTGFITRVDYSIVFGAFADLMFFIVIAQELTRRQTPGYFVFGYAAGIFGAGFVLQYAKFYSYFIVCQPAGD